MNSSSVLERIQNDMMVAMKARDADTLSTLRMLKSALMEAKTKKPKDATLTAEEEIEVIQRYAKKRRESIEEFRKLGALERIPREEQEVEITQRYMPQAMPEGEIDALVRDAIAATGATSLKDMGKVIGVVMAQVKGRAEGGTVSRLVRTALGS